MSSSRVEKAFYDSAGLCANTIRFLAGGYMTMIPYAFLGARNDLNGLGVALCMFDITVLYYRTRAYVNRASLLSVSAETPDRPREPVRAHVLCDCMPALLASLR